MNAVVKEQPYHALLLTLGHNASAIYLRDHQVVVGYENERITKVKSDSSFPSAAIHEIKRNFELPPDIDIYISHWIIDFNFTITKWWDQEFIDDHFPNSTIYSLDPKFTHHSAHAWSVKAFCGKEFNSQNFKVIVADGFGNMGETFSIYDHQMNPIFKSFGFETSLGLLYQYATSFLGMKENQDEYKLLGYEAIKNKCLTNSTIEDIHRMAHEKAQSIVSTMISGTLESKFDPLYMKDALVKIKMDHRKTFEKILRKIIGTMIVNHEDNLSKVIIATYVQRIVEKVLSYFVQKYDCKELMIAGGLFLNVKLNRVIAEQVSKLGIMPLAGDQGAAIGLYAYHNPSFTFPSTLCWGKRNLNKIKENTRSDILILGSGTQSASVIAGMLNQNLIVNLVRGDMEFGPRSLCNTSTLALPSDENKEYIDKLNDRESIMPMAPVLLELNYRRFFEPTTVIGKSLRYMICTTKYHGEMPGVSCADPDNDVFTGRPQLVTLDDMFMTNILDLVDDHILINTSLNEHGMPIVFNIDDVVRCHEFQKSRDDEHRLITIVII